MVYWHLRFESVEKPKLFSFERQMPVRLVQDF
jgi:hypothetical protein